MIRFSNIRALKRVRLLNKKNNLQTDLETQFFFNQLHRQIKKMLRVQKICVQDNFCLKKKCILTRFCFISKKKNARF